MWLYMFIAFFAVALFCIAYVRISCKFWVDQPVMHFYDIKYWFKANGIIDKDLPEKNKFCNFKQIHTYTFQDVGDVKMDKFVSLIQNNYLQNRDNVFLPLKENIIPYFANHTGSSFWSFYWEESLVQHMVNGKVVENKNLIGAITSRPVNVVIHNSSSTSNKPKQLTAYYVDYLCVHRNHRKKGIAPQLIQTHEYNQRHSNQQVRVSIFKREEDLTGIIPLCCFNTYAFSMKGWNSPLELPGGATIVKCTKTNLPEIRPYIYADMGEESPFEITVLSDMGNLLELMHTNNVFVYFLVKNAQVIGIYFFRKTCLFIEKDAEALCCFASIYNEENGTKEEFVHGYKLALSNICASPNTTYKYAVVEKISHNDWIVDNLTMKTKPTIISPTAYFFYNYAHKTVAPNKVLMIN